MITSLVLVSALFVACGLGALGAFIGVVLILFVHVFASDITPVGQMVVALFVTLVPVAAGLAVILVERLSEVPRPLTSVRAVSSLFALTLLMESGRWIDHLLLLLEGLRGAEGALVSALVTHALGAMLFCAAATALLVTFGQISCQVVTHLGVRLRRAQLEIPWPAVRLLGALILTGAGIQLISSLFVHELSPKALLRMAQTQPGSR